jgi:hypothetical protein
MLHLYAGLTSCVMPWQTPSGVEASTIILNSEALENKREKTKTKKSHEERMQDVIRHKSGAKAPAAGRVTTTG